MRDTIYREDAIKALTIAIDEHTDIFEAVEFIPSADRPSAVDLSSVYSTAYKSGYEKGKADGAMIYGNEHNCIMTIFGECSYAETGCGDCAVVEKVRKALSADRPQEWIPCSERLPEKEGVYLVTISTIRFKAFYRDVLALYFNPKTKPNWFWHQDDEVVAWMPLPKPWKGVGDEMR